MLRAKVIERAYSFLGYSEADGRHKIIIDIYNKIQPLPRGYRMTYADPWCAAFVSAVGQSCGLTGIILPECGCNPMIKLYANKGLWIEDDAYRPRMGDLVFYDWQDTGAGDNIGDPDHVGFVAKINGSLMTIIEGNISDKVGEREIAINSKFIRGFATPNYEGVPLPDKPVSSCIVTLPILRYGATGAAVKSAQILLIGWGYSCGSYGADGEIGPDTDAAIKAFQTDNELTADGIVGAKTWNKLIN